MWLPKTRREIYAEVSVIIGGMKAKAMLDGDGVRADKCRKLELRISKLVKTDANLKDVVE